MPSPLPSLFRSKPIAAFGFVVAFSVLLASAHKADAHEGAGALATFVAGTLDDTSAGRDAGAYDGAADAAEDAAESVDAMAASASDVATPMPAVVTTTGSAAAFAVSPDEVSSGLPLTHRQWLYVLIAAGLGVLILMAVPTRA